jgi:uncharacterized membrane protein
MQNELSLAAHDLAVVTREAGDEVTLQEAVDLSRERDMQPTFWKTLLCLLFAPGSSPTAGGEVLSASLTAIGINAAFRARLAKQVRPETSALLVLVNGSTIREKVLSVLRGFRGEIVQTELTGDGPEVWQHMLIDAGQMEGMK